MIEYSLFDKIKTVFNLVTDSPLFLILLLGIILMIVDILYISKKDKTTKVVYIVISLMLTVFFMYSYIESLSQIFDTIAKNIVAIIYFPTVLEYILMLIISIIMLIISIFSKKITTLIKKVNIFVLITNGFLFFLILDEISKTSVDLTNKISIYTNSNLMMLLELSIIIFVIWIIGLVLYKTIKVLSPKEEDNYINLETTKEKPEPVIEYVVVEKEKEELFSLDEYKQMKEFLKEINKNK